MIKLLTIISMLCVLTSCSSINGYVKHSANDKTFDSKGFNAKKRAPMYNKKYIQRAKRNVEEQNFDQEHNTYNNDYYEPGELKSYQQSNRKIYNDMLQMSKNKQAIETQKSRYKNNSSNLKDFDQNKSVEVNLKNEIRAMKKMLEETQKTISTYKCPVEQNMYQSKPVQQIKPINHESKDNQKVHSAIGQQNNQSLLPSTAKNACIYNEDLQITECRNIKN